MKVIILNEYTGEVEGGLVTILVNSIYIYEPTGALAVVNGFVKLIKYPLEPSEINEHEVEDVVIVFIPLLQLVPKVMLFNKIGLGTKSIMVPPIGI